MSAVQSVLRQEGLVFARENWTQAALTPLQHVSHSYTDSEEELHVCRNRGLLFSHVFNGR